MLSLILTAALIGVTSSLKIHWDNTSSPVTGWGSPSVQILTPDVAYCAAGLFYDKSDNSIGYVDRSGTIQYYLDFESGEFWQDSIYQSVGDGLAFVYPSINEKKRYIIGTGNNLVLAADFEFGILATLDTIPVTREAGYEICKAHADKRGTLFLTLNSKADKKHNGGRLYKFEKQSPKLVKEYKGDVDDFAWNPHYTYLYLIKDNGKTIVRYDYDLQAHSLSNEQVVFTLPVGPNKFKKHEKMTGIEMSEEDCLWVTVDSGDLLEIHDGKIIQVLPMPVKALTGITFGGPDRSALIISTTRKCAGRCAPGTGSLLYVAGINSTGYADVGVMW